jgi:hypothetical protein
MKRMNLKPAFAFRFQTNLRSAAIFCLIMAAICVLFFTVFTVSYNGRSSASFISFGFASAIALFVIGVTSVREDLRLGLQNGVGRRTVFFAQLLATISLSFALAVAGDLILLAEQALTALSPQFQVSDLFYAFYTGGTVTGLPFGVHVQSILFSFLLFTFSGLTGAFLSLCLTLADALEADRRFGGPILLLNGVSHSSVPTPGSAAPVFDFFRSGPQAVMLLLLLFSRCWPDQLSACAGLRVPAK